MEQESQYRASKRKSEPPVRFKPNFEPTHKRKEATFLLEDEADDLTDLSTPDNNFNQLLSCIEQNLGKESGKLKDQNEELIKSAQDIGNPDPKSQKAIDEMPERIRKHYNDATKKEYEGMKSKGVMEFVRISDLSKNSKIYICVVNWVTKYVLGVYQKPNAGYALGDIIM
jgi:hypothetical protein